MKDRQAATSRTRSAPTFDAVVVGASLAGSTATKLLAEQGLRVALVERQPDASAYKRVCGHFVQSSAMPALERLGVVDAMLEAGAVRSRFRVRTPWGWIEPPPPTSAPAGINLRREHLDPMLRERAAAAPGVELLLGQRVTGLVHQSGTVAGVRITARDGSERTLRSRLVVGADGRDSAVARLAGLRTHRRRHGRFAFSAYYAGPKPAGSPDASVWCGGVPWGMAFPTDSDLTLYVAMDSLERRAPFRADPAGALEDFIASRADPPPIRDSERVSDVVGRIDMTSIRRAPVGSGVALAGDAALAADPLWGVGCGWAVQSGDWLAGCVGPALNGAEPLRAGLARYRARRRRALLPHALLIESYATGRELYPIERLMFAGGVHDRSVAERLNALVTRNAGPLHVGGQLAVPRAILAVTRIRNAGAARELPQPVA
ncbi:MAG TPA: NAD(P)/FAD-dependent oxidoreductase [Thermoleophilaceae bacterium]